MADSQQAHDSFCAALNIPDGLHQNGRLEDQIFFSGEKVYRRLPFFINGESTLITDPFTNEKQVSFGVIKIKDMSCVREKSGLSYKDCLYNDKEDRHYFEDHYVLELDVNTVNSWLFKHPTENERSFNLKVEHDPLRCIYPHIEIRSFNEKNERIAEIKTQTCKDEIKFKFQKAFKIIP